MRTKPPPTLPDTKAGCDRVLAEVGRAMIEVPADGGNGKGQLVQIDRPAMAGAGDTQLRERQAVLGNLKQENDRALHRRIYGNDFTTDSDTNNSIVQEAYIVDYPSIDYSHDKNFDPAAIGSTSSAVGNISVKFCGFLVIGKCGSFAKGYPVRTGNHSGGARLSKFRRACILRLFGRDDEPPPVEEGMPPPLRISGGDGTCLPGLYLDLMTLMTLDYLYPIAPGSYYLGALELALVIKEGKGVSDAMWKYIEENTLDRLSEQEAEEVCRVAGSYSLDEQRLAEDRMKDFTDARAPDHLKLNGSRVGGGRPKVSFLNNPPVPGRFTAVKRRIHDPYQHQSGADLGAYEEDRDANGREYNDGRFPTTSRQPNYEQDLRDGNNTFYDSSLDAAEHNRYYEGGQQQNRDGLSRQPSRRRQTHQLEHSQRPNSNPQDEDPSRRAYDVNNGSFTAELSRPSNIQSSYNASNTQPIYTRRQLDQGHRPSNDEPYTNPPPRRPQQPQLGDFQPRTATDEIARLGLQSNDPRSQGPDSAQRSAQGGVLSYSRQADHYAPVPQTHGHKRDLDTRDSPVYDQREQESKRARSGARNGPLPAYDGNGDYTNGPRNDYRGGSGGGLRDGPRGGHGGGSHGGYGDGYDGGGYDGGGCNKGSGKGYGEVLTVVDVEHLALEALSL